jgi:DNA-directed RNA polymerase
MNKILREEFVRLHTEGDLLQRLRAELVAAAAAESPELGRLLDQELQAVPGRGSLQLNRVNQSRYFFS